MSCFVRTGVRVREQILYCNQGIDYRLDLAPLLVVGVDVVVEAILGLVFAKAQAKQKQRDL